MAIPSGLPRSIEPTHRAHQRLRKNSLLNANWLQVKVEKRRVTRSNDCGGLSPLHAGLADGGRCDFSPVDHFLHAVVGHSDDYLLLWRGRQATIFEVYFPQTSSVRDNNTQQMFLFVF